MRLLWVTPQYDFGPAARLREGAAGAGGDCFFMDACCSFPRWDSWLCLAGCGIHRVPITRGACEGRMVTCQMKAMWPILHPHIPSPSAARITGAEKCPPPSSRTASLGTARSFPLGFQTSPRAPNYPSLAASHVVMAWFLIGNITCVVSSAHDGGEQPRKKVAVPSTCDPGRRSLTLYMTESKKASFARPARRRLVVPSPGTRQAAVRGRPSSLDPVRYPDFRFFCPSRLLPYSVPARTLQRRLR
ncbi:hypothetical protein K456DRAFT_808356 [Colletotrichum gloeosporioides 23]|nr:hypothetical protein K456DRAFT_808356 [Colletotrichum gloeosporioides 23]